MTANKQLIKIIDILGSMTWKTDAKEHAYFLVRSQLDVHCIYEDLANTDKILINRFIEDEIKRFETAEIDPQTEEIERAPISFFAAKEYLKRYELIL